MATPLENLKTRRAAICEELAALSSSAAGGKPNSGQIDHTGYKAGLYRELEEINKQIENLQAETDGAWFETQRMVT